MKRIGLFLLLVMAANAQNLPYVGLHNVAGNAGQTVNITVNLANQGTAQIAGLQFDLVFDKTAMGITAATGTAANAAGKFVATNSLATGLRVIVTGFNQNLIDDGGVANLTIAIGAAAPTGNYLLTVANTSATDPSGATVTLGQLNGHLTVGNAPTLTVNKTHTGNFAQGQSSASYTITVSNQAGAVATSGAVTAAESLPSGLTLVSMAGTNWDCSGVTTCTRSDALNGGASYNPITVTVSVANNAAASVTNSVTVSGGGSLDAFVSDPATINVPLSQTITFAPLSGVSMGVSPFTVSATASSGLPVSFSSTTTGVCAVLNSTVAVVNTGTCTIVASQAGNGTFAAAASVPQSFTVSPGAQTINFTQPPDTALNAGPVTLTATATSTLAVSFTSTTTAVCTVSAAIVTLVTKGSCSITASQPGNGNYNGAPTVTKTFNVLGNSNVITFPQPADIELFAGPVTLTATANSALAVTYSSNSTAVCTVAGSSVTLVSPGACSITANQAGDPNFAAAAAVNRSFTVLKGSQTITFSSIGNSVFGASPITLAPTASSTLAVTLTGTTNAVCTVSGFTVTIAGAGNCSITATQAGNANYAAAPQVVQSFTVAQATQTITFNALNPVNFGAAPFVLSATSSSALAVSYASTTQSVCTITNNNTLTFVGVGACSITASQAGNTNFSAATPVTQGLTVSQGSQTITFGPLSSAAKDTAPFTIGASASSGLTVSFASTTTGVCTVSNTTVTIVDVGNCSITASQAGNANYTVATSVTQSFNVAPASQTITFAALPGVTFGAAAFGVTATASSGLPVTFTSTTLPVCTVSTATVTIVGAGTCTINADQAGNAGFGAAPQVSRSFTVAKLAQTITFATPGNVAFGVSPLTLTGTASSTLAVTFASSTSPVCTVSGTTLTVVGVGSCSVTASQAGDANTLAAADVPRTFTVSKGSQTITFNPLSNVALGTGPITLVGTASSTLAVSFASTTTAVCTVSGTTLTLVTAGACSVTASQAGTANYNAATSVVQGFNVTAGSQTITFNAPANTTFGTAPFTINATTSSSLAVGFTSTTTAVCTVVGNTVTLAGAGTCSITANQAGDSNFAAATPVSQSFTVGKGSQTITFGPLNNISLGVTPPALSATASSTLAVTFTSPTSPVCTVSGTTITLIDVGTCTIAADQPGGANYNAATTVTQSFTVAPGTQTITFAAPAGVTFGVTPFNLVATTTSHLTIAFASTTQSICTVAASSVTILAAGTCSITADQAGNSSFAAAPTVSRSFTVAKAPQTITFATPADVIMGVSPFSIAATASSNLTVAFASTSSQICTVSGVTVTIVGAGTCSVTATQAGDSNYLAATAVSRSFAVAKGPQAITFGPLSSVAFGVSPITLTATSSASLTVTFSSSTLSVCTVSGTTLTVVGPGNCSVTASQAGSVNYAAATPVIQAFIATGTQTITFPAISDQAFGTPPFELGATSTAGLQVSYASTTQSICTVSGATVTLLAVGGCSITASQSGNGVFVAGSPVSLSFSVLAPPACEYSLSPVESSFSPAGGTGILKVTTGAGCAWTATPNAGYITLDSNGGTDTSVIGYTVAANSGSARSGTITVSGQTFTVNQFGAACSFALSVSSLDFTAAAGSATISIGAPVNSCNWTGTAGDPAVTVAPAHGTAPSQITVSLTANPNVSSRSLTATIGGQTLTLNQAGKNCTVTLTSSSATIPAAGGFGSVGVTTQTGCSYSTLNGPNWINVSSGGSGTGPGGTLFYTVDANSTTVPRTGAMSIGGQAFQITQPGVSCEISLDTSNLGSPFASAGGASVGSIGIFTSNPACNWSASTRASWLTFNGAATGTGAGTVTLNASTNATLFARSGVVTIAGQQVNVSQSGTTCGFALRSSIGHAPSTGGAGSVGVVSAPGCTWTSSSNDLWLTINSSANTGTGDVQFTAAANPAATARSGTLTIAGKTYTVAEAGAPCNFSLSIAGVDVPVNGVTAGAAGFTASATGCTANAVSFSNWLTVSTSLSGQTGAITYNAAVNTGPARIGLVKLGDSTFSVIQAGASCTFVLSSPGTIYAKGGGSGSFQITASGSGCSPSASSDQSWLTAGSLTGPSGNVFTQSFTVGPFSSAAVAVRVAKITIGGKVFTIKQTSW